MSQKSRAFFVQWRGHVFNDRMEKATAVGIQRAGIFFHGRCRGALNIANTGTRRKRTRDTKAGKRGSGYTTYDNPSAPGEPPRKRTGHGQRNVVYEFNRDWDDPKVRVGVKKTAVYMAFLELGTKVVAARPWLMATLRKYWGTISRLAAIGGKGMIGR